MAKCRAQSALAGEILAAARARSAEPSRQLGWLARLAPEHRGEVEAARDQWLAAGGTASEITAKALGRAIVETMTRAGYRMPGPDGVAKWLTGKRQ